MTAPYTRFHGLQFSIERDGVTCDGDERLIESFTGPGRDLADLFETGQDVATYSFSVKSKTRSDIEEIVAEINNAPDDVEFEPWDAERTVYAAKAHASRPRTMQIMDSGTVSQYYYTDIVVYARNGRLLGPESIVESYSPIALPLTLSGTNAGYYDNTFDYLFASGYYGSALGLTRDLSLEINDYQVKLCDCLIGKDKFKADRYGNVTHTWKTEFTESYELLQGRLMGSTFFNWYTDKKASLLTDLTNDNSNCYFEHWGGDEGNDVSITIVDPGGTTTTLSITASGSDITVNLGRADSAITTTPAILKPLWDATDAVQVLHVTMSIPEDEDGSGLMEAMTHTHLTGGEDSTNRGSSIAYQELVMGNLATFLVPFYGPLPCNEVPYMEIVVDRVLGSPKFVCAFNADLSDIMELDQSVVEGVNKVYIPNCEGEDFIAVGITTDENSTCTLSSFYAEIHRYISDADFPVIASGEDFTMSLTDGEFSNHMLTSGRITYRDLF